MHIPSPVFSIARVKSDLNKILSAKLSPGHPADYVVDFGPSIAWLNEKAFASLNIKEPDAERAAGEALKQIGMPDYYTRTRLAGGDMPNTEVGLRFAHSYAATGAWYVMAVLPTFAHTSEKGGDHGASYTYDRHVPLLFFGIPFQPGTYRSHAEPVDLAPTLASLLGINAPTAAVGRVLTEALAPLHHPVGIVPAAPKSEKPSGNSGDKMGDKPGEKQ
jgi:arylsulfatase A-like enzyme